MDWVHEVFLATSPKGIQLSNQLLRGTPIGIITTTDGDVTIVKEAERKEPDNLKLTRLLSNTTGFCWICGRTFNMVEQAQRTMGGTFIAHREQEPTLFRALEQTLGKKIRTKGSWVPICVVCSRIIGNSIHEYITRLFENVKFPPFDFDELFLEEDRKLMKDTLEKKR
jgi:hypothetical protein